MQSLTSKGNDAARALKSVLDVYCAVPLVSTSDICKEYRESGEKDVTNSQGAVVMGVKIPNDVSYYDPPGISLDSSWQAEIGVKVRGIDKDISGADAFALAKKLAKDGSRRMLEVAEQFMKANGHEDFWKKVKTTVSPTSKPKEYQFEKFNHFPFQFFSTGPYPVNTNDNGYYLRIVLKTSSDANSGTDASIKVSAGGKTFVLDYMPQAPPLIGYNDFEKGDETVYTIGPFNSMPSSITIKNDAPDMGDILDSLGKAVVNKFVALGSAVKNFFKNNADYVGTNGVSLQPSWLQGIARGGHKDGHVYIDGGNEGKYNVNYRVYKLKSSNNDKDVFRVSIRSLKCIKESKVDGLSSNDEPFLMAALHSHGLSTREEFWMTSPFSHVDTGETKSVNRNFRDVTFEKPVGVMVLNFRIWESDNESSSDRNRAFDEFKGEKNSEESNIFSKVSEAIAADWNLGWIRVYAFHRGKSTMKAGDVLYDGTDRWIEGGHSHTFKLNTGGLKTLSTEGVWNVPKSSETPKPTNELTCQVGGLSSQLVRRGRFSLPKTRFFKKTCSIKERGSACEIHFSRWRNVHFIRNYECQCQIMARFGRSTWKDLPVNPDSKRGLEASEKRKIQEVKALCYERGQPTPFQELSVYIQSNFHKDRKVLRGKGGGENVDMIKDMALTSEMWNFEAVPETSKQYFIKNVKLGQYLMGKDGVFLQNAKDKEAKWEVYKLDGLLYAFQNVHTRQWLRGDQDGNVNVSGHLSGWEKWQILSD